MACVYIVLFVNSMFFLNHFIYTVIKLLGKGQLISKCLFGVFTFFQKLNENTSTSSKVESVFSLKKRWLEKIISNFSDL